MKLTHDFELNGKKVTGRCTFRAINAFEESSGMSIADAWQKLMEQKLSFTIMARAVWAFVNGERISQGQKPESFDVIGAEMHQHGFQNYVSVAGEFFALTFPETKNGVTSEAEPEKKSND